MLFDLSHTDLENLLGGFLTGTQSVELKARVTEMGDLPESYRKHLQGAQAQGRAWAAWWTDSGILTAWCDYDIVASRKQHAFVLYIAWAGAACGQHALWCYCYPDRPTDWVIGRPAHEKETASASVPLGARGAGT
jgi:hypothetical protein